MSMIGATDQFGQATQNGQSAAQHARSLDTGAGIDEAYLLGHSVRTPYLFNEH